MSKDPAFLFYTKDFLGGISDLTMEERGQYITLLCLQHEKGRLTKKLIDINIPNLSEDVLNKFITDKEGSFYNTRLEVEIGKRKDHADKQRQRALDGWKKRKAIKKKPNAAALPEQPKSEHYIHVEGFFSDWNEIRKKLLRKVSKLNSLGGYEDKENFDKINKAYPRSEIRSALAGLFKQKTFPKGMRVYTSRPSHFLKTFETYHQAWYDNDFNVWGDSNNQNT